MNNTKKKIFKFLSEIKITLLHKISFALGFQYPFHKRRLKTCILLREIFELISLQLQTL